MSAVTRRLAAIVVADVVGYTRLMEHDEAGTHERLKEIRVQVVDPRISQHGGRIIHTAGDGMLVEFGSATAALRCAIEVQREMGTRNLYLAPEERIEFRIGINLGDIIVDGDDIAGDGVNVAARLETLAEPGGICISATVLEHAHEDLGVGLIDIGEQQVKNIVRPIRVYRVTLGKQVTSAAAATPPRPPSPRGRWLIAAIAAIGVIGVGVLLGQRFQRPPVSTAPPPFSMAILPFLAPSGSPSDELLANELTQDLTTALGRWRMAQVASRGLVGGYKGKSVDARTAGRELNMRHLVEGELGRSGDKTVVTMRVIDTATGTQEWSDRMDFDSKLLEAEPMALLMRTYVHLRVGISRVEMRRAVREPAPTSALNLWLRGEASWSAPSDTLKGLREARKFYDEALRLDPDYVPALLGRIETLHWELYENLEADRAPFVAEMDALSRRAVAIDGQDPRAWQFRAETLIWLGRWEEAMAANANAQALDPASYWHLVSGGWLMYATGRPAEAIALTKRVIAIDPPGDIDAATDLCRGNLMLGRYGEAVPACEKAAALDDATWHNQVLMVSASAQNGDMQKAGVAKAELLKRQPRFSIAKDKAAGLSEHPDYLKMLETHYYPGLRKAGLPEK